MNAVCKVSFNPPVTRTHRGTGHRQAGALATPRTHYQCEQPRSRSAMADNLSIDRRTSALLVMDFQTLIVDNYAAGPEPLLDRTAKLIDAARTAGVRVIYVVVGFRPGYPEVSDRNATFNGLKASGAFAAGAENAKIHFAVAPLADEIVVT